MSSHSNPRKKILFLTPRFPYPLVGGDRLKPYHLLRHLAEIADVDLIALDEHGAAHYSNPLSEFCKTVTVVPFRKAAAWMRVLRSLLSAVPAEYAWYDAPEMRHAVNVALKRRRYDLIIAFFGRTALHIAGLKGTPRMLIAEDSRVLAQERASERFAFSPEYFIRRSDRKKLAIAEPALMRKFDLVTFVASPDEDRTLELDPMIRTAILTNGVDLDAYHYHRGKREDTILFAGELSIYHNRLMAERILTGIYPMIRQQAPQVKLIIAGGNPDPSLVKLAARTPGTEFHANADDLKPYYTRAKVFLHPQEVGAGIQNKLLEALALGTAVVTTPMGASGIAGLCDTEHCIVRTSDSWLAGAALELLADDALRARLAQNGRTLIEEHYSWDHVFRDCDKLIRSVVPGFFYETEPVLATA